MNTIKRDYRVYTENTHTKERTYLTDMWGDEARYSRDEALCQVQMLNQPFSQWIGGRLVYAPPQNFTAWFEKA